MENNVFDCREKIVSEEYGDFIIDYSSPSEAVIERYGAECYQELAVDYSAVYVPLSSMKELSVLNYPYKSIPTLYGLMDTVALEDTGILRLQNQSVLNLKGNGTIIGIIDTGIDYTHKAFFDESGRTRILKIWDQSINSGITPVGFGYGSEYNEEDINRALESDNPFDIVPSRDEIGHGTFLAGVAGGSEDIENDFIGAVPECKFVVVKLKPAKQYLRDYYMINDDAVAFQENDIMIAISYLREQAKIYNMPISIVLGMGSNRGSHSGKSPLATVIDDFARRPGGAVSVAAGNEGDKRHHFSGIIEDENDYEIVEVQVGEDVDRFMLELWGRNPEIFSIGLETPTGEIIPKIDARIGEREVIYTIFDRATIEIEYAIVEQLSGDELILIRIKNPSAGVWKFNVYVDNYITGAFDVWLGISDFISNSLYFLEPEPDNTITAPGDSAGAITVSSYDATTGAIDSESSRGFLRTSVIKPDIAAPGVRVMGPRGNDEYTYRTGTSIAAALTAGAAAQILNWGLVNGEYEILGNQIIKSFLIRGATRDEGIIYPNRQWGYGKLNVYNSLVLLR